VDIVLPDWSYSGRAVHRVVSWLQSMSGSMTTVPN